jgi:hypothetical protein
MRVSHLPLRAATGAFILNEGLGKRSVDPRGTAGLPNAFPQLASMSPSTVGKGVVATELALGGLLLAPFVSPLLAGGALAAFGAGMLQSRFRSVERDEEPEKQKTVAKDLWMLGTGLALVLDSVTDGARRTSRRTSKAAKRAAESVREALPVG